MVQTRSVTARFELLPVNGDDQVLPQDNAVELSPGGDASSEPRTKKRRRLDGTESPKKRRRRKREELCQLNLDVLFLIAEYIHPVDLLNLARTCKSLRELLMDKSSAFIWKTARRQVVGLPVCPTDLTEPEYANLVFCARCHSCGKPARTVLWSMRRRYCQSCKRERLWELALCNQIIRNNDVLANECLAVDNEVSTWVDMDQMELFLDQYHQSVDKEQFLNKRREQNRAIHSHACSCERWQQTKALERIDDLAARREKREQSIFERLEQLGYRQEVAFLGRFGVREYHKAFFRTSKPLTNKEWDRMWPELRKTMDDCRLRRMNAAVYQPRRKLLASEYNTYVTRPTPDGPTFDFLPHAVDLACFGPFRDIIRAPEGTQKKDRLFASAFAQLPDMIAGWRKKLDTELAELVKIPLDRSLENAPDGQGKTSSSTGYVEASQTDSDKLRLACAMFCVDRAGSFTHLNALSVSMRVRRRILPWNELDLERTGSIRDRFCIEFLEEAPYIVRTCGLDPGVATVDDMDRRNARLRCLSCEHQANIVMNWRAAMWHASSHNMSALAPLSEAPRWQLVSDEHIDAIQAVEQSEGNLELFDYTRCLLCRPRVGDAHFCDRTIINHVAYWHKIEEDQIKRGVHYTQAGISDSPPKVEIVEGEKVTFKVSTFYLAMKATPKHPCHLVVVE